MRPRQRLLIVPRVSIPSWRDNLTEASRRAWSFRQINILDIDFRRHLVSINLLRRQYANQALTVIILIFASIGTLWYRCTKMAAGKRRFWRQRFRAAVKSCSRQSRATTMPFAGLVQHSSKTGQISTPSNEA